MPSVVVEEVIVEATVVDTIMQVIAHTDPGPPGAGLPSGGVGDDDKVPVWVGPGPHDYELQDQEGGPGGAPVEEYTAGVSAPVGTVVALRADGRVTELNVTDPDDATLAPLVLRAASTVDEVVEVTHNGLVTNPGWTWTPGEPVFLGGEGQLTQAVPTLPGSTFLLRVGHAVTATAVFVDPQDSVLLAAGLEVQGHGQLRSYNFEVPFDHPGLLDGVNTGITFPAWTGLEYGIGFAITKLVEFDGTMPTITLAFTQGAANGSSVDNYIVSRGMQLADDDFDEYGPGTISTDWASTGGSRYTVATTQPQQLWVALNSNRNYGVDPGCTQGLARVLIVCFATQEITLP